MKRMLILLVITLILSIFSISTSFGTEPVRIDGSSDAAAQASWIKMLNSLEQEKMHELTIAFAKISLVGVNSVFDLAKNPDLMPLSITKIKDQVDGLTADQIIQLGNEVNSTITAEIRMVEQDK